MTPKRRPFLKGEINMPFSKAWSDEKKKPVKASGLRRAAPADVKEELGKLAPAQKPDAALGKKEAGGKDNG